MGQFEKIIFLDFDGVLVTFTEIRKKRRPVLADESCVAELNRVVDVSGAAVVLSTSWRVGNDIEELAEVLKKWGFLGTVVGKTPVLRGPRGEEIQAWMESTRFSGDFVILDDDSDMVHLTERLVRTDPMVGLSQVDADSAIGMLASLNPFHRSKPVV